MLYHIKYYICLFQKGHIVHGLENIQDSILFHAGLKLKNDQLITNGGRVLAITSFGDDLKKAITKTYGNVNKIKFKKVDFRKDIGLDLL